MSFTQDDLRGVVIDAIGPVEPSTILLWIDLANRELLMRLRGLYSLHTDLVAITGAVTPDPLYVISNDVIQYHRIALQDASGDVDCFLEQKSMPSLWRKAHRDRIGSESRKPEFWAHAGVGTSGGLGFRIYPSPVVGTYVGLQLRVWSWKMTTLLNPSDGVQTQELFAHATVLGVLKLAYLYAGDRQGYRMTARDYMRAVGIIPADTHAHAQTYGDRTSTGDH